MIIIQGSKSLWAQGHQLNFEGSSYYIDQQMMDIAPSSPKIEPYKV